MSKPSKIGTGGRRGVIADDWADNKLTDRDRAAVISTPFGLIYQNFRPEWTTESGSPGASGGELDLPPGDTTVQAISTPSSVTTGTWLATVRYEAARTVGGPHCPRFIVQDDNNYWARNWEPGNLIKVWKTVNGTNTPLYSPDPGTDQGEHDYKTTRDSNGNFESFWDGVSMATGSDTWLPTANKMHIQNSDDHDFYMDDLKVY